MRTYGRISVTSGGVTTRQWVMVQTAADGNDDAVYLNTLIGVLQGIPGESPFYAQYGVPVFQSVQTQVPPDIFLARAQEQFAPYFAALSISRTSLIPVPTYQIDVTTTSGAVISQPVPT